ncbi:MAG: transposase, partial [Anaerolineaceae bacterium]
MKDLLALFAHLLTTLAKLLGPGGAKAIVADSLLMKQQLLIVNRSRRRAPNLTATDRLLYTAHNKGKPGPKGPSRELIDAIVELKRRNPRFGYPRIAQQINKAFGTSVDKDVVRGVLAKHYRPGPGSDHGPFWLTFIGHLKDSLWSADLFRCESVPLKTH